MEKTFSVWMTNAEGDSRELVVDSDFAQYVIDRLENGDEVYIAGYLVDEVVEVERV